MSERFLEETKLHEVEGKIITPHSKFEPRQPGQISQKTFNVLSRSGFTKDGQLFAGAIAEATLDEIKEAVGSRWGLGEKGISELRQAILELAES